MSQVRQVARIEGGCSGRSGDVMFRNLDSGEI